jgi:predicted aspartyl protease
MRDTQGLVSVPVTINGGGPFTFVLDTGSSRSAVSTRLARRLRLSAVATTNLMSSTATASVPVVRLDGVGVGGKAKHGLLVPVLPIAGQASLGDTADGVLGQDFLLDQNYTLDYDRLRLVWRGTPAPDRGDARLTLKNVADRWLVALPQDGESQPLWFVPDSGAETFVIFDRGGAARLQLTRIRGVTVQTVTGHAVAMMVLLHRLQVGSVVLRDLPAVVVTKRPADAPAADGLLPLSAFSQVTFDAGASTLLVRRRL